MQESLRQFIIRHCDDGCRHRPVLLGVPLVIHPSNGLHIVQSSMVRYNVAMY